MIEPAYVNLHKSMRDILAPLLTDSYKLSHLEMSSNGINKIYSNFTPRFVTYFEKQFPNYDGKIVWFGLQAVIKQVLFEMWEDTFFNKDKTEVIQELKDILGPYIGMTNFKHFEDLYDLGYMPIEIKALKEGSLVSPGIPCFTIINTLNGFQWLPNFLESILTVQLWKMMTTASVGRLFKINSEKYALLTNGSVVGVEFQNHDFSLRGQAGFESAGAAGAGFLLSSSGTDNVPALMFIDNYYNTDIRSNPQAFSVRASEHSIATLGIQIKAKMLESDPDHPVLKLYDEILLAAEHLYLEELLIKFPEGILSYVSDSYDFYSVISKVLPNLKDLIMNRKGKLTVRPDSGDPVEVVAGIEILDYSEEESLDNASYKAFQNVLEQIEVYHACPVNVNFKYKGQLYHTVYVLDVDEFNVLQSWTYSSTKETTLTVEEKGTIETLYDIFGGTTNSLGFKLLDEHIGIIYGDGITIQRSTEIFERLMYKKFSSINCVFGVGAFSLNLLSRDSLGIAFKATAAEVDLNDGNGPILLPIYKDPKTDTSKKSAKGLLKVTYDSDTKLYNLEDNVSIEEEKEGLLETVYIDGKLIREDTFEDIKNRMYS